MPKPFSQVLRELRTLKGWSGEQVAGEAGLSQGVVSKYENGERNPKRPTIERLAKALGVAPDEMLIAAGYTITAPDRSAPRLEVGKNVIIVAERGTEYQGTLSPVMMRVIEAMLKEESSKESSVDADADSTLKS